MPKKRGTENRHTPPLLNARWTVDLKISSVTKRQTRPSYQGYQHKLTGRSSRLIAKAMRESELCFGVQDLQCPLHEYQAPANGLWSTRLGEVSFEGDGVTKTTNAHPSLRKRLRPSLKSFVEIACTVNYRSTGLWRFVLDIWLVCTCYCNCMLTLVAMSSKQVACCNHVVHHPLSRFLLSLLVTSNHQTNYLQFWNQSQNHSNTSSSQIIKSSLLITIPSITANVCHIYRCLGRLIDGVEKIQVIYGWETNRHRGAGRG